MNRSVVVAVSVVLSISACEASPTSRVRDQVIGTWQVIQMSEGWIGDTIALDPAALKVTFERDGAFVESVPDGPERMGSYRVELREDIGLQRQAMMLDLTGEDLTLHLDAPFEVSIEGDTMALASTLDDGYDFRLARVANR